MSDYISNLAIKSLGPSELIRPRLASLFEPPFAASRPVFTQDFGWEVPDMAPTSGETRVEALLPDRAVVRPAVERQMKPQAPIADLHTPLDALDARDQLAPPSDPDIGRRTIRSRPLTPLASQSDAPKSEPPPGRPAFGDPLPGSPHRPAPPLAIRPSTKSAIYPNADSHVAASVNAEGAINSVEVAPTREPLHGHARSENALLLVRHQETSDRLPSQSSVQRHSPSAIEPIVQRAVRERITLPEERPQPALLHVERSVAEAAITVSPHIIPAPRRGRAAQRLDESIETTQSRPIIRVTIGRVEVRAVTPPESPAPRAATRRPAPILSLDDYLKQVNERRR